MKTYFNRICLMGELSSPQWMENTPIYQEADEENLFFFVSVGETLKLKIKEREMLLMEIANLPLID